MFVPFDFGRDGIRPLALSAVIEKPVSRFMGAETTKRLGIHAGPEERDVANVPVHIALGESDPLLCFTEHLENFGRRSTIGTSDLVDRIQSDESEQHVADVVNQLDICHTELGMKDVLV